MMRALLLLGTVCLGAASSSAECAVDGAEAVDELANAAVYIWAATERCAGKTHSEVHCSVDIASAIESVNSMINIMVGAINKCGAIKTENKECGMAAGELTDSAAGLAAASSKIVDECPNANKPAVKNSVLPEKTKLGSCVVDTTSAFKGLFYASKKLSTVNKNCKNGGNDCTQNALNIVSAFADLGAFVAGAANSCAPHGNEDAACAEASLDMVAVLHKVANAGLEVSRQCKTSDARLRLYEEAANTGRRTSYSSTTLALAAFLPITAIVSFVGGRFIRNRDARNVVPEDEEMLVAQ